MKNQNETFTSLMHLLGYRYNLRSVFDDFLTMAISSYDPDPIVDKSYDEKLYLKTVAKYEKDEQHLFYKLLTVLKTEIRKRRKSNDGNDVIGEFYESNLSRRDMEQISTSQIICKFMGISSAENSNLDENSPCRIVDCCCGSGRMLLSAARLFPKGNEYYGIDVEDVCVKMTVLNLFLNGISPAEVMCANLASSDFKASYKISFLPRKIVRIMEKENSKLWHLMHESNPADAIMLMHNQERKEPKVNTQLTFF